MAKLTPEQEARYALDSPAGDCGPACPGLSVLAGWEGMTVPKMTPAQEAAYALDFNISRDDLRPEVQAEYDRLLEVRREAAHALKSRASRDDLKPEVQAEYDRLLELRRVRPPESGSGMTVGAQGTVTIWDRGDSFLSADDHDVTLGRQLRPPRIAWAEISRFEDGGGWSSELGIYWHLVVVLRTGKRETVGVASSGSPAPETVAAVNRVAERHGIPADVAGVPMENGKPVVKPGFWTRLLKGFLSSP